ncbi:MAG: hypothetical protein RR394_08635 [Oscillospiraceae bacterium]
MKDRDLEHPEVRRALDTGYPRRESLSAPLEEPEEMGLDEFSELVAGRLGKKKNLEEE